MECLGGVLVACWRHLGSILGRLGRDLDVSWGVLGASWGVLEASWGDYRSGRDLQKNDPHWRFSISRRTRGGLGYIRFSIRLRGRLGKCLGCFLERLGGVLEIFGEHLEALGRVLVCLGVVLGRLGSVLGRLGGVLGVS